MLSGSWKIRSQHDVRVEHSNKSVEVPGSGCGKEGVDDLTLTSRIRVGCDGPDRWLPPLIFSAVVIASWALRPADRRLQNATLAPETRPLAWAIPIGILLLLLAISYLTLPKGPPPG